MNEYESCARCPNNTKHPIGFWDGRDGSGGFLYTCENEECPIAQRHKASEEEHIRRLGEVQEVNWKESIDVRLFRSTRRKAGISLREAANLAGIPPVEMSAYEAERKPFPPETYRLLINRFKGGQKDEENSCF